MKRASLLASVLIISGLATTQAFAGDSGHSYKTNGWHSGIYIELNGGIGFAGSIGGKNNTTYSYQDVFERDDGSIDRDIARTEVRHTNIDGNFGEGSYLGAAIGANINSKWSTSIELAYFSTEFDDLKIIDEVDRFNGRELDALLGTINLRYNLGDHIKYSHFDPYIGGGFGFMTFDGKGVEAATVAVGKLFAGVDYQLTPHSSLFAEYNYLFTSDAEFVTGTMGHSDTTSPVSPTNGVRTNRTTDTTYEMNYSTNILKVGYRYWF